MKSINITTLFTIFITFSGISQTIINVSFGGSVDSTGKFAETFDFDLNRSEEMDEESNGSYYSIGGGNSKWYFEPTASISIGSGLESSSNDVLSQLSFFYLCMDSVNDTEKKSGFKLTNSSFMKLELNPTINSDKNFRERLYYQQFRLNYNFLREKYPEVNTKLISSFGIVVNPYFNIGGRNSRDFNSTDLYSAGGLHSELILKMKKYSDENEDKVLDKFNFKLKGDGLYVISEANQFNTINKFRYSASASFNVYISQGLSIGVSGEIGTITPYYQSFNNVKIGVTFKK